MSLNRWLVLAGLTMIAVPAAAQSSGTNGSHDRRAEESDSVFLEAFPDALIHRGAALFQAGDFAGAQAAWEEYMERVPKSSDAAHVRLLIEEAFVRQYPAALAYQGIYLFHGAFIAEALEAWERYLELAEPDADAGALGRVIAEVRGFQDRAQRVRPQDRDRLIRAVLRALPDTPTGDNGSHEWEVDSERSLAWWQVEPHLDQLWATTCPEDPTWSAGDGRDAFGRPWVQRAKNPGIPLFPRHTVRAVCGGGVAGQLVATDTVQWRDAAGEIVVRADRLVSGLRMRDAFIQRVILASRTYPEIRFDIEDVAAIQAGDTLRADMRGTFELRGVRRAVVVPIEAWRDAGGLRLKARFSIPLEDLILEYGVSELALPTYFATPDGEQLHMGVDVVLRPTRRTTTAARR